MGRLAEVTFLDHLYDLDSLPSTDRRHATAREDLGSGGRRIVIDFNFTYHPSCRYDPRWACPLAPAENTVDVPVSAGSG